MKKGICRQYHWGMANNFFSLFYPPDHSLLCYKRLKTSLKSRDKKYYFWPVPLQGAVIFKTCKMPNRNQTPNPVNLLLSQAFDKVDTNTKIIYWSRHMHHVQLFDQPVRETAIPYILWDNLPFLGWYQPRRYSCLYILPHSMGHASILLEQGWNVIQ